MDKAPEMLFGDELKLRWRKLAAAEVWTNQPKGFYVLLPTEGLGQYDSPSGEQVFQPGEVVLLNAAPVGRLRCQGAEFTFGWFVFSFEQLLPLLSAAEMCRVRELLSCAGNSKVYSSESAAAVECHRLVQDIPPESSLGHRARLLAVIAAILSEELAALPVGSAEQQDIAEHFTEIFNNLSASELLHSSIGQLASRFRCGRRHLNRIFHQRFGFSVSALRMELRLLNAVALLREPGTRITEVARQCGFNSLSHFTNCFIRRFGRTPGRWRNGTRRASPEGRVALSDCRLGGIVVCPLSEQFLKRSSAERESRPWQHHLPVLSEPDEPAQPVHISRAAVIS